MSQGTIHWHFLCKGNQKGCLRLLYSYKGNVLSAAKIQQHLPVGKITWITMKTYEFGSLRHISRFILHHWGDNAEHIKGKFRVLVPHYWLGFLMCWSNFCQLKQSLSLGRARPLAHVPDRENNMLYTVALTDKHCSGAEPMENFHQSKSLQKLHKILDFRIPSQEVRIEF